MKLFIHINSFNEHLLSAQYVESMVLSPHTGITLAKFKSNSH